MCNPALGRVQEAKRANLRGWELSSRDEMKYGTCRKRMRHDLHECDMTSDQNWDQAADALHKLASPTWRFGGYCAADLFMKDSSQGLMASPWLETKKPLFA